MNKTLRSFLPFGLKENKASQFSTLLSYQTIGQPLWTSDFFENQVSAGYKKNAVVYRCVTLITRSLSTVPLVLYRGENTKVTDHPLLSLLRQPNPLQNYASFCESVTAYLLLAGNSFIEAVALSNENAPIELYSLRPDRLSVIPGPKGFPAGYEYHMGSEKRRVAIDPVTGESPILHIQLFNPLDDHLGMSPLTAAQHAVDLQNTIAGHNLALLQNAGCPSGALMIKGARLTQAQHAALKDELEKLKDRGVGKMLLLEGDFEWKEMGLSPKDMDFSDGKNMTSRDIAQIFGIPPMCIGILGDSTFSNYQEARLHLWEDTLIPMLDFFVAHLNHWLTPLFGDDLFLSYNKDEIHALIPRREKLWERVNHASCLTINERRKILGYEPLPEGDVLTSQEQWSVTSQEQRSVI